MKEIGREKLEIERIKRKKLEIEIQEIIAQFLNERNIKRLAKRLNIELRKESKEFILNVAKTISNTKILK